MGGGESQGLLEAKPSHVIRAPDHTATTGEVHDFTSAVARLTPRSNRAYPNILTPNAGALLGVVRTVTAIHNESEE